MCYSSDQEEETSISLVRLSQSYVVIGQWQELNNVIGWLIGRFYEQMSGPVFIRTRAKISLLCNSMVFTTRDQPKEVQMPDVCKLQRFVNLKFLHIFKTTGYYILVVVNFRIKLKSWSFFIGCFSLGADVLSIINHKNLHELYENL